MVQGANYGAITSEREYQMENANAFHVRAQAWSKCWWSKELRGRTPYFKSLLCLSQLQLLGCVGRIYLRKYMQEQPMKV